MVVIRCFFSSEKSLGHSVELKVEGFLGLRFSCEMTAGMESEAAL